MSSSSTTRTAARPSTPSGSPTSWASTTRWSSTCSKAQRPDREQLTELVDKLEDPTTDLVRRDAQFTKLGITDADVETPEQVIDILEQHPQLLQRPVLVKGDRAIIGRPKTRVPEFLG